MLYDVVHVLVASAGEVNEDGAGLHLLCKADSVGNSVAALNGGNDALKTGEGKESHPRAGAGTPPPNCLSVLHQTVSREGYLH